MIASVLSCAAWAADISGAWQFSLVTPNTKGSPSFEFKQSGETLTGTTFDAPNTSGKFNYQGKVDGPSSMQGDFELVGTEKGTFTATKK